MQQLNCYLCHQLIESTKRLFVGRTNADTRFPICETCKDKIPSRYRMPGGSHLTNNLVNVYSTQKNGDNYTLVEIRFSVRQKHFEQLPTLLSEA